MFNEQKYRRWAWGALIGLAVIIVIAGIIMATTASSPKPNTTEVAQTNTEAVNGGEDEKATEDTKTDDSTKKDDQKTETQPQATTQPTTDSSIQKQSNSGSVETPATTTTETSNIPKTGPEDTILPIFALAICGSLFAYNVVLFKKNA